MILANTLIEVERLELLVTEVVECEMAWNTGTEITINIPIELWEKLKACSIKLLPCPFCGGKPILYTTNDSRDGDYHTVHRVKCHNEACEVRPSYWQAGQSGYGVGDANTDPEARRMVIKAWNTRAGGKR